MTIQCESIRYAGLMLGAGIFLSAAVAAQACAIDGVASLSVNGTLASLNGGAPSGTTLAKWAPFTLDAATPNSKLRFTEDLSKIRGTLPAEAFKTPFRWTFSDGTTVLGQNAVHQFGKTGQYTLAVSYYWPSQKRWLVFDRASVPIVAANALWKPPVAHQAGDHTLVLPGIMIGFVGVAAGGVLLRRRTRPALLQDDPLAGAEAEAD